MTLCREWTLVKQVENERHARPLKCRSWSCELCRPDRKAQLLALCASGSPTRFITLTINPKHGASPSDRLGVLSHAWKVIVKRLRRLHPNTPIEYLAVVEETKAGEPHLHILFRGPYIPQRLLSDAMMELAESPIVDIRRIKTQREVVTYVAKYVTKAPAQFDRAKRYWHSKGYELDQTHAKAMADPDRIRWRIDRRSLALILQEWFYDGYWEQSFTLDTAIATQGPTPPLRPPRIPERF